MFNRIKRLLPTGILAVGILVFCILSSVRAGILSPASDYESLILSEQIHDISISVIVECMVGAALFKILLKKEKSEDRDSGQKL